MRIYRVSDIRTDNYIVVSGSRTTAPFIIQEEWSIIINVCVRATLLHNCLCKALSAPNRACTAVPDKDIIHAVTRENRGLWSVCIGILKCRERIVIQFTDFKSGNYHRGLSHNFRVGSNQIPLCSSQKRKAAYIPPENRGYVCTGSNLLPENSGVLAGRLCVLVTDISGERLIREWEGSRRLLQSHYNKRVFGSWILLPNMLY